MTSLFTGKKGVLQWATKFPPPPPCPTGTLRDRNIKKNSPQIRSISFKQHTDQDMCCHHQTRSQSLKRAGHLQEAPTTSIMLWPGNFGILQRQSLMKAGSTWRYNCIIFIALVSGLSIRAGSPKPMASYIVGILRRLLSSPSTITANKK